MLQACFFIPVSPNDSARVLWTVKSIRQYCSEYRIFLLLDGTCEQFSEFVFTGSDGEIIWTEKPSGGHWGTIWQMQNRAMIRVLQRTDLASDCIFVKIDADALIIKPGLIERAQKLFASDPTIGQLGQCHRNIVGQPLLNRGWSNFFAKIRGPAGALRMAYRFRSSGVGWIRCTQEWFRCRKLLRAAESNGYRLGEFAIGGAYILRLDAVRRMFAAGWLTHSPLQYFPRGFEDVITTPHIYAVGFRAVDDVDENGIFAVCGEEPWVHPLKLRNRGHYIIHPIKYGATREQPFLTETQLSEALLSDR